MYGQVGEDQRLEAMISSSSVEQRFFFETVESKDTNRDVIDFLKR